MQGIRFRWFVVNEICRKNLRDKFYCLINANLFTIDWNCITLDWKLFISGRPVWYRLYLESPDRPIRDFDPRPWSPRWLLLLLFCHFSVSTFSPESSHIHLIKKMESHYKLFINMTKKKLFKPVSIWNRIRHWQKIEIHRRKRTWARKFSILWAGILL